MCPLSAAVAACKIKTFASSALSDFLPFKPVFVRYSHVLMNLALLPLEQFANKHNDYL